MKNEIPVWPGWTTVKLLGRGTFGGVYEIERDFYGDVEKAALKVIDIPQNDNDIDEMRNDGYDDASITATFNDQLQCIVKEYTMMKKLNGNTNVVNCDDVVVTDHEDGIGKTIMIKMELLTALNKAVPTMDPLSLAVKVGRDICKALILCERNKIIHRDIKPQNIFVSDMGAYKLGDFGVSRTMERTTGGTKTGTPDYMAPEIFRGDPYNHTVDIYSLGIVLFWLLNGRRTPFLPMPPQVPMMSDKEEARARRMRGEPIPAPAWGSPEMNSIIAKACAFRPEDRYQTAEEMLHDLEEVTLNPVTVTVPKTAPAKEPAMAVQPEVTDYTVGIFGGNSSGFENSTVRKEKTEAHEVPSSLKTGANVRPIEFNGNFGDEKTMGLFASEAGRARPAENKPQDNKPSQQGTHRSVPAGNTAAKVVPENVKAHNDTERTKKKSSFGRVIAALCAVAALVFVIAFVGPKLGFFGNDRQTISNSSGSKPDRSGNKKSDKDSKQDSQDSAPVTGPQAAAGSFRLAAISSLSGDWAKWFGIPMMQGIELAVEEINALEGYEFFELLEWDDAFDPEIAAAAFDDAADWGANIIVGPFGGYTITQAMAGKLYEFPNIFMICPGVLWSDTVGSQPYLFQWQLAIGGKVRLPGRF